MPPPLFSFQCFPLLIKSKFSSPFYSLNPTHTHTHNTHTQHTNTQYPADGDPRGAEDDLRRGRQHHRAGERSNMRTSSTGGVPAFILHPESHYSRPHTGQYSLTYSLGAFDTGEGRGRTGTSTAASTRLIMVFRVFRCPAGGGWGLLLHPRLGPRRRLHPQGR